MRRSTRSPGRTRRASSTGTRSHRSPRSRRTWLRSGHWHRMSTRPGCRAPNGAHATRPPASASSEAPYSLRGADGIGGGTAAIGTVAAREHGREDLMGELPGVLELKEVGPGRFTARHPDTDPEGRDVVFSGQLLAQMIMAADAATGTASGPRGDTGAVAKEVTSVHAIFARAGRYSAGPMELAVESMHAGRTWASSTVTALQGDRLLSRGLVLSNAPAPDLVRHAPAMPDVPRPDDCEPAPNNVVFAGAEARTVELPDAAAPDGSPLVHLWVRAAGPVRLGRCQPGDRGVVATRPDHRRGAPPPLGGERARRPPVDLDGGHLPHGPLPRSRRRLGLAALRTPRDVRRTWAHLRDGVRCSPGTAGWSRPSRRTAWPVGSRARSTRSRVCDGHARRGGGGAHVLLTLEPDQEFFRDTTAKFLDEQVPVAEIRHLRHDPAGFDERYWRRGAELGWTSLLVGDERGGGTISGQGTVDLSLVAYEFGRRAAPGPLVATNLVASALDAVAAPAHAAGARGPPVRRARSPRGVTVSHRRTTRSARWHSRSGSRAANSSCREPNDPSSSGRRPTTSSSPDGPTAA